MKIKIIVILINGEKNMLRLWFSFGRVQTILHHAIPYQWIPNHTIPWEGPDQPQMVQTWLLCLVVG